jgi:hypothetical protein
MMKFNFQITSVIIFFTLCFSAINLQAQEVLNASGGKATGSGGTANYSIGQITFNTTTSSGGITISQGVQQPYQEGTLPITLRLFDAIVISKTYVKVIWETTTEINNSHFTVEKRKNGTDWVEVAVVNASKNNSGPSKYQTLDNHPFIGTSFYRLKQTDTNGLFSYSPIKSVYIGSFDEILAYPNPTSNNVTLKLNLTELQQPSYMLFDLSGKTITEQRITDSNSQINLRQLGSGTYFIKVLSNKVEIKTFKIIKN